MRICLLLAKAAQWPIKTSAVQAANLSSSHLMGSQPRHSPVLPDRLGLAPDCSDERVCIPAYNLVSRRFDNLRSSRGTPGLNCNNSFTHLLSQLNLYVYPLAVCRIHASKNQYATCGLHLLANSCFQLGIVCCVMYRIIFWNRVVSVAKIWRLVKHAYQPVVLISVSPRMTDKNVILHNQILSFQSLYANQCKTYCISDDKSYR